MTLPLDYKQPAIYPNRSGYDYGCTRINLRTFKNVLRTLRRLTWKRVWDMRCPIRLHHGKGMIIAKVEVTRWTLTPRFRVIHIFWHGFFGTRNALLPQDASFRRDNFINYTHCDRPWRYQNGLYPLRESGAKPLTTDAMILHFSPIQNASDASA